MVAESRFDKTSRQSFPENLSQLSGLAFDPVQEISRATEDLSVYLRDNKGHVREAMKKVGVTDIDGPIFNRKVWGKKILETKNDHKPLFLDAGKEPHYLFSNINLFTPIKQLVELVRAIGETLTDEKAGTPRLDTKGGYAVQDYFRGVRSNNWRDYFKILEATYAHERYVSADANFDAFNNSISKCIRHPSDIDCLDDVFNNVVSLLRMPVSGGIPNALDEQLISSSPDKARAYLLAPSVPRSKSVERWEEEWENLNAYPVEGVTASKKNGYRKPKKLRQNKQSLIGGNLVTDGKNINNEIISKILVDVSRGLGLGNFNFELTALLAVPVYERIYESFHVEGGDIQRNFVPVGFLMGWLLFEIHFESSSSRQKQLAKMGSRKEIVALVESCLSQNNWLVEQLKGSAAREIAAKAPFGDNRVDRVRSLGESAHYLSGWSIEDVQRMEDKEKVGMRRAWCLEGNGDNRQFVASLGTTVQDGQYVIGAQYPVIRLRAADDVPFAAPGNEVKRVYYNQVVKRLRTVDMLLLVRGKDEELGERQQATVFAHQTSKLVDVIYGECQCLPNRAQFAAWMLNVLTKKIWGDIPADGQSVIESPRTIFYKKSPKYVFDFILNEAAGRAMQRLADAVHQAGPRMAAWEYEASEKAANGTRAGLLQQLNVAANHDVLAPLMDEGMLLLLYQTLWPALRHGWLAHHDPCGPAYHAQAVEIKIDAKEDSCILIVANAPHGGYRRIGQDGGKDKKFLQMATQKLPLYAVQQLQHEKTGWYFTTVKRKAVVREYITKG